MSNVEIVINLYESFGRGDIAAVLGGLDSNIQWHEAEGHPYRPSGEAFVGADEVMNQLFAKIGDDWDPLAVHPITFHDAGNVVVVEVRYEGNFKSTGRSLDCQGCHVWTLENGKATKFQQYIDTAQLKDVMGA